MIENVQSNQLSPNNITKAELMSRKEAAAYLGVAEQTLAIWKCTKRYDVPCVKIGRLAKYRRTDLDAFINSRVIH